MNGPISFTDSAISQIKPFYKTETSELAFKFGVYGGGCSGFSYRMDFGEKEENETEFEIGGLKVFMVEDELPYIHGSTIDYNIEPFNGGWLINNPNSSGSCGCGGSFRI